MHHVIVLPQAALGPEVTAALEGVAADFMGKTLEVRECETADTAVPANHGVIGRQQQGPSGAAQERPNIQRHKKHWKQKRQLAGS